MCTCRCASARLCCTEAQMRLAGCVMTTEPETMLGARALADVPRPRLCCAEAQMHLAGCDLPTEPETTVGGRALADVPWPRSCCRRGVLNGPAAGGSSYASDWLRAGQRQGQAAVVAGAGHHGGAAKREGASGGCSSACLSAACQQKISVTRRPHHGGAARGGCSSACLQQPALSVFGRKGSYPHRGGAVTPEGAHRCCSPALA